MRRIFAILATAVLAASLANGFAQESLPQVDVKTVSSRERTISDFIASQASSTDPGPDVLCYAKAKDMGNEFNCLDQALQTTGLNETLAGAGPFTVCAPTDAAFEALANSMDPASFEALFTTADALKPMLSHHVLVRKLTREDMRLAADAATGNAS